MTGRRSGSSGTTRGGTNPTAIPGERPTYSRAIADLITDPNNLRTHDEVNLAAIMASLKRFGQQSPIVIDSHDVVRKGSGTLEAARRVGWESIDVVVTDLAGDELTAYGIADNRTAELADWDLAALAQTLPTFDPDLLNATGWQPDELEKLVASLDHTASRRAGRTEPDAIPDEPAKPRSRIGSVWRLGEHRIMCGDSTDPEQVQRLTGGDLATMVHADPPYGMGKENVGVMNDNLRADALDQFQMSWWDAWAPATTGNASVYIWGTAPDLFRLWWRGGLQSRTDLLFRNELVWDKGAGMGQMEAGRHMYPTATERALFLMRGQQFLGNQNKDEFWAGYEPLRKWLADEVTAAGWKSRDVNRITGTAMAGHWLTQSQFIPIPERHYVALQGAAQGAAFTIAYHDLFDRLFPETKAGGNDHRRDLAAQMREARTHFDNLHDNMNDVWRFPRVTGDDRHGHATPKPVAMVERAIRSSSQPGDLVAVPFAGTCPEVIAAQQNNRRVAAMELTPAYVDLVCRRFQEFTDVLPINDRTGKAVDFTKPR